MNEAEKRLVAELGENVCIYTKVCLHYAAKARKSQGRPNHQIDWNSIFRWINFNFFCYHIQHPKSQKIEKAICVVIEKNNFWLNIQSAYSNFDFLKIIRECETSQDWNWTACGNTKAARSVSNSLVAISPMKSSVIPRIPRRRGLLMCADIRRCFIEHACKWHPSISGCINANDARFI